MLRTSHYIYTVRHSVIGKVAQCALKVHSSLIISQMTTYIVNRHDLLKARLKMDLLTS